MPSSFPVSADKAEQIGSSWAVWVWTFPLNSAARTQVGVRGTDDSGFHGIFLAIVRKSHPWLSLRCAISAVS